jgi:hypothetical protein
MSAIFAAKTGMKFHFRKKETESDEPADISCRNCETVFRGNFCPHCGQSVKEFDRPLRFILLDFTGNLFAFDTRLWMTIKHLLFKPGVMEKDFSEGKRIRYMPPFRLYLFVSFIFFLVVAWVSQQNINESIKTDGTQIEVPEIPHNNIIKADFQDIRSNPAKYSGKLIKYFSWSLFFLMPFYAFLLWLFFRRSRPLYVSHLNPAINQHVFIFLILLVIMMVDLVFPLKSMNPENYLVYLIPVYAVTGIKRFFDVHWLQAIWKTMVVGFLYIVVLMAVILLLIFLTFSGTV